MYFPTEPGVAIPAWRVLIWQPVNAYYVIVDAHTGTMLWRKNLTDDQSETATYQVYNNPNAMMQVADSPAPLAPYISANTSPADGAQGAITSRVNVTIDRKRSAVCVQQQRLDNQRREYHRRQQP